MRFGEPVKFVDSFCFRTLTDIGVEKGNKTLLAIAFTTVSLLSFPVLLFFFILFYFIFGPSNIAFLSCFSFGSTNWEGWMVYIPQTKLYPVSNLGVVSER